MATIREVSEEELQQVIKSGQRVFVDFFSSTCSPCKMLSFILDDVAKSLEDDIEILKVDMDKNATVMEKYAVSTFPAMVLFEDGEEKKRLKGLQQKPVIIETIKSV